MTQLKERAESSVTRSGLGSLLPSHYHPIVATAGLIALILGVTSIAIAVGAVMLIPEDSGTVGGAATVVSTPVTETPAPVVDAPADPAPVEVTQPAIQLAAVLPDLTPKAELPAVPAGEVNVSYAPEVPAPSGRTTQAIIDVHFEVVENVVEIDPATGVEYETWGYRLVGDGQDVSIGAPGPMIRGRVGDVLRFTVTNPETNTHPHNVDFHAVTGQGGGAANTVVAPGETRTIEARLLYPGLYMYHCAYGDVPLHISHGMYGGILVDPAEPLPEVDHEWYIVQSEYYTDADEPGLVGTDRAAITNEEPTFVVFNGARGALTGDNALGMAVGERARIYFVNAGLNLDSNFHPIGSHWDVVYQEAALLSPPILGSQTTLVPAGGGVVAELVSQVPSTIILVDHALSRTFDKGAVGQIVVEGPENPEIFEEIIAGGETEAVEPEVAAPADAVELSIMAGSGAVQEMGVADEFAESESPADFSINVLTVPVGTTVTWTNQDTTMHTVTAVDGSFDSGYYGEGESWSFTFTEAGEYEYYCIPHPWMRAKVIVEG
ncbi:MAG TPA: copper-containing nitrite reductase [Acidimicrobiia bacterium]|jgi:nitrite reductase (NO-forming)